MWNDHKFIQHHHRPEISPELPVPLPPAMLPEATFHPVKTEPTLPGYMSLVRKANWPTLQAQTVQAVAPLQSLLAQLHSSNFWEQASAVWRCQCVPPGTVVKEVSTGKVVLACGDIQCIGHVGWELETV